MLTSKRQAGSLSSREDGYTNSLFVDVKPPTIRERAKIKQRREYPLSARIVV
uniref:Putative DNA helicase n=1 Tax=Moniliophthora roreri TaxID=221103 RepID=A0A0W0FZ46_MONRR